MSFGNGNSGVDLVLNSIQTLSRDVAQVRTETKDLSNELRNELRQMGSEVNSLGKEVATVRGRVTVFASIAGVVVVVLFPLLIPTLGKSYIAGIVREEVENSTRIAVREERVPQAAVVQYGQFYLTTKVDGVPYTYRWVLRNLVDMEQLVSVTAEPIDPLPGIAVTAEIVDDGRACVMRLIGDEPALGTATAQPIKAKVVVVSRHLDND